MRQYNVLFVNDRPLIVTRAETLARVAMGMAFLQYSLVNKVEFIYPDTSSCSLLPNNHPKLANRPLGYRARVLGANIPRESNIIYLRCGAIAGFVYAIRNWFNRRYLVQEVHNYCFGHNPISDCLYRIAFYRCQIVVTVSENTAKNWRQAGVAPNKIKVLPSGVNINDFLPINGVAQQPEPPVKNWPKTKPIIVYAGNLYRQRGIEDIIACAAQRTAQSWQFVLAGGTSSDVDFYKKYTKLNYPRNSNVHYPGYQSPRQIPAILRASDLLLITYSLQYKNIMHISPLKLIEAMASGTPIITVDVPGTRYLLSEAEAYFYQPDNPVSLLTAIQTAIDHPGEARIKARRALARAAELDWQKRVAKIFEFINK